MQSQVGRLWQVMGMRMRFFALVFMAVLLGGALMGCARKRSVDSEYGYETKELYAKRDEHQIYAKTVMEVNNAQKAISVCIIVFWALFC